MRIAFVTFEYPPFIVGGAGIYALHVTQEISKLGHDVVVFTPDIVENTFESDIHSLKIHKIPINKKIPFKALQFWLRLPNEIKKCEKYTVFDIIHFNGISYWFLKKRLSKAKHIVTVHHLVKDAAKNNSLSLISRIKDLCGENGFFVSYFEKRCIKFPDKLVSVSNFTKKQIIESYNVDPDKIKVIYNGIDSNGYSLPDGEVIATKRQLGLDNKPIILFVGRVDDPRKGLDFLLKSLKQVLQKMDVILLVVGKGDQSNAKRWLHSLGISDKVIFTGFVEDSDLKKYYLLCDIYICSSRLEGFGLTLLEAMAARKPIVTTNVGAISEIIIDGFNGRLVDSENIENMADVICTLLKNQELRKEIGENNWHYVSEKFSWSKNACDVVRLYSKN